MTPLWSKVDTHCAVCLRPFSTEDDMARHHEQECEDPGPCWCEALCWAEYGGHCEPEGMSDDLELFLALRTAEELVDRLRGALASVRTCGCGVDCASRCRHVSAKDCTGCEEIETAALALLAAREDA